MLNEEGIGTTTSMATEAPSTAQPVEAPPVIPQAPTQERAKGIRALLAKLIGRRASPATNTQASMSSEIPSASPPQTEASQPLSPPTTGTPTT